MEFSIYLLLGLLGAAALIHLTRSWLELRRMDRRLDSARLMLEARLDGLKRRLDARLRSLGPETAETREAAVRNRGGRGTRNLH